MICSLQERTGVCGGEILYCCSKQRLLCAEPAEWEMKGEKAACAHVQDRNGGRKQHKALLRCLPPAPLLSVGPKEPARCRYSQGICYRTGHHAIKWEQRAPNRSKSLSQI